MLKPDTEVEVDDGEDGELCCNGPYTLNGYSLMRELRKVRRDGYASNNQQSEEGVGSVAVAIVAPGHGLLGALSIATPTSRLTSELAREHASLLQDASARVLNAATLPP